MPPTDDVLTGDEIRLLNKARALLIDVRHRGDYWHRDAAEAYALGRVNEAAQQAEERIVDLLINANVWGKAPLSDDQLHNREPLRAVPS